MNGFIGLSVFLYGIKLLTNTLEKLTEKKFQHIIYTYTNSSVKCFLIGVILTAICGSSTAITAITLSFISSKHLTFRKGLIIVIASNIGTSFASILFNFDFYYLVPIFMFFGIILHLFATQNKLITIANIIMGCSFLFFGLNYLVKNLELLLKQEALSNVLIRLNSSNFTIFWVGIFVTALIQSSNAGIGMVQKLSNLSLLNLGASISFMLGANIGTTLTVCVASLSGTKDSKIVAFINLVFNLVGSIIFMLFISLYEEFIYTIGKHLNLNPSAMISLSHIIYNIITVFLFLLFLKIKKPLEKKEVNII